MNGIIKKVKDAYDSVNLPEKVKKQGLEILLYSYDNSDRLRSETMKGGITIDRTNNKIKAENQ